MIILKRLEVIRGTSPATADELQSLQQQLNAASLSPQTQLTVGSAGSASALPATPSGYVRFTLSGRDFVMPFYAES